MKIRIKGNSLRLRLTQEEVDLMASEGKVSEIIQFGMLENDKLIYTLMSVASLSQLEVGYEHGEIAVKVPSGTIDHWTATEEVGFMRVVPNGGKEGLTVLVEKDFQCMIVREGEDESKLYPNPKAK